MNINLKNSLTLITIFLTSGCFRISDEQVVANAKNSYREITQRYNIMIANYASDEKLIEAARDCISHYIVRLLGLDFWWY